MTGCQEPSNFGVAASFFSPQNENAHDSVLPGVVDASPESHSPFCSEFGNQSKVDPLRQDHFGGFAVFDCLLFGEECLVVRWGLELESFGRNFDANSTSTAHSLKYSLVCSSQSCVRSKNQHTTNYATLLRCSSNFSLETRLAF